MGWQCTMFNVCVCVWSWLRASDRQQKTTKHNCAHKSSLNGFQLFVNLCPRHTIRATISASNVNDRNARLTFTLSYRIASHFMTTPFWFLFLLQSVQILFNNTIKEKLRELTWKSNILTHSIFNTSIVIWTIKLHTCIYNTHHLTEQYN